ncbi:DUF2304 domain-containing protein [Cellulomonas endophytica]|uniref:DUF2304 domain-containing protein n=1 Tax=Cellulomonas endophytica TaxID=2494735 RepID=UPI00101313DA|nr:DUF2304 domain-containing protein [Cellulomonas endophytica]
MTVQLLALLTALVIVVGILEMVRRRELREKYAALWVVVGLVIVLLAAFPGLLARLADLIGVEVPANLLFFLALVLLLAVSVHLSWELSKTEEEMRVLAEEVAILRLELDRVRLRLDAPRPGTPSPDARRPDVPVQDLPRPEPVRRDEGRA